MIFEAVADAAKSNFAPRPGIGSMKTDLANRLRRLNISAAVRVDPSARPLLDRTWLTITSSHLGRSTRLHAEVCRYISRSMIDARRNGAAVLVTSGSAIEPWACRAAELFSVPIIWVHVEGRAGTQQRFDRQPSISVHLEEADGPGDLSEPHHDSERRPPCGRDAVVNGLADQIDCVFVRRSGKIERCLRLRLRRANRPVVRIAVVDKTIHRDGHRAARDLMTEGAIGWYCCRPAIEPPRLRPQPASVIPNDWTTRQDEWLVHCTRACDGPWPGQTESQHRDELLLAGPTCSSQRGRDALDSLCRIVRQRRVIASALASHRSRPVVCFSAVPLAELLRRRQYRSHLHRWDYEPYGIALRKDAAIAAGCQSVIYGTSSDRNSIAATDRYRFQSKGSTYDWTKEQEWRFDRDVILDEFDRRDIRLFVKTDADARRLPNGFAVSVVGEYLP